MAAKIKKGDKVVVLAGRDKGRSGEAVGRTMGRGTTDPRQAKSGNGNRPGR